MSAPRPLPGLPDDAQVAEFLRTHPGFLAQHPELYRVLTPPARVHGEKLADHMAAMLRAERRHASAMADHADGVLAAGRAAAGLAARVQSAVLALIRAADPVDCVSGEMPGILALDAAAVCMAGPPLPGARPLRAEQVAALLAGRDVVFRDDPDEAAPLHGEAAGLARHDALIRLPGLGPPALIALAARDRAPLDPAQGTGALAFLGRAVAAALRR